MLQLPKPKYNLNDCVDLAAPTVVIVGVGFNSGGPEGPVSIHYDVLQDQQIHRGVPEEAIACYNAEASAQQAADWAARRAAMAGQERLQNMPTSKLGEAIGGGLEHSRVGGGLNGADVVGMEPVGDLAARREARDMAAENGQPAPVEDPDLVRN
jgi:hypothetical protein